METTKKELTRVQRDSDNKFNLIDANDKLFFDKWFECIGYFDEGLARVQIESNGKFNLITENGKFLSEQWFDWIADFDDGLALVQKGRENPRFNYIDKDGKIISDEWFRWVDYFRDGIARVQRVVIYIISRFLFIKRWIEFRLHSINSEISMNNSILLELSY